MTFKPDQPIKSAKEDILGRQAFANALSDALCAYKDKNSIVVGLYGAWGSGKTSIINMALEHIDATAKTKPLNDRPVIVRFNPWNYSDQNQLITQFFKQLSSDLKRADYADSAKKIGNNLETYALFFQPFVLVPNPWISIPATIMTSVFSKVGNAAKVFGVNQSKDLYAIKDEINKLLEKSVSKIVIVIDDIDRLNNTEIRQMFQLIKSVGDFSNTIYVLAFDKKVVIDALKDVQKGSGEEYLKKIVQIPFEVPLADNQEIEHLFFSQLDQLIGDIPTQQWDQTHWGNIYHSGLKYFFNNIRDVTRYINSLRLSIEMVKGEINAIDFLAITGLQVFLPDVYAGIRDNKNIFLLESKEHSIDSKKCDEIINRADKYLQGQLKDLLKRLFPRLKAVYGGANYGDSWLDTWRKDGRVCSPDLFDIYFRLSLPKNEISQKEINRILSVAGDYQSFSSELKSLNEQDKIVRFLERLEDYTEQDIRPEYFNIIIKALINLGDSFPEGRFGFFSIDTPMRILRLTHQMLRRLQDKSERYNILESAFNDAVDSLHTIVHEVSVQDQEHGRFNPAKQPNPDKDFTLPDNLLDKLEKIALQKIQLWAKDGKLSDHPQIAYILYRWSNWGSKQDTMDFVSSMTKTDKGIVKYITAFVSQSMSQSMSDYVGKIQWRISLDGIKQFVVDIQELTPRVREIVQGNKMKEYSEKEQNAMSLFLDT